MKFDKKKKHLGLSLNFEVNFWMVSKKIFVSDFAGRFCFLIILWEMAPKYFKAGC